MGALYYYTPGMSIEGPAHGRPKNRYNLGPLIWCETRVGSNDVENTFGTLHI